MALFMPFATWPERDRQMWVRLVQAGGPFDDRGPLADLRPISHENLLKVYGRWLSWLARSEPEALSTEPASRATLVRLRAWLEDVPHLSPTSQFDLVLRTLRILTAANPDADWRPQKRLEAYLRRAAGRGDPERKRGRIVSSALLLSAGLRHAADGSETAKTPLKAAICRRDGLMVAMLAVMPMRIRAFGSLAIGTSLFVTAEEILVSLSDEMTKTAVPWEAPIPEPVAPVMRRYLEHDRPLFVGRQHALHNMLWVNNHGRPYGSNCLGKRIAEVTTSLTGVRVPPHFFRDSAATTLARLSPRAAQLIRPVLGHSDYRTAQKHYNHATALDAGRDYAAVIARLKRDRN